MEFDGHVDSAGSFDDLGDGGVDLYAGGGSRGDGGGVFGAGRVSCDGRPRAVSRDSTCSPILVEVCRMEVETWSCQRPSSSSCSSGDFGGILMTTGKAAVKTAANARN